MDHGELQRLASNGFAAVPPDRLATLAEWCWDWCEETGRGAYCSVSQTLHEIEAWWDEHAVVPVELHDRIDTILTSRLPPILEADDATAARMARALRQEVEACLLPPDQWPGQAPA